MNSAITTNKRYCCGVGAANYDFFMRWNVNYYLLPDLPALVGNKGV